MAEITLTPVIISVLLTPNPVDTGQTLHISIAAVEAEAVAQTEGLSAGTTAEGVHLQWTAAADLFEGLHAVSFSISDRDGNTSTVHAVYTVDVTPPGLTLSLPDAHRVVDSETICVAGQTWDGISGPPQVVITVNGKERWRSEAAEDWSAGAVDFAADLERLQDMFARGMDNWTAEEKMWFASTLCHRGAYDVLDVNRVEAATDFKRQCINLSK